MSERLSTNVKRYGVDADLPARRTLHAGPVRLTLENADLRYIYFGDVQVVLRLYVAVRDPNWNTIEPIFSNFTVDDRGDAFRVDLMARHVAGDVDFAWSGIIEGTPEGTVRYRMDGAPRRAFMRNRIGFCVLHPMELAGVPATIETPNGTIEGGFPDRIAPDQPFVDMISISHPAGQEGRATIRFEGDLFETEDQRNWTDASFKTYSTPLRLPYPVEVTPADRIVQSVAISMEGKASLVPAAGRGADVAVDINHLTPLPAIGFGAGSKPLQGADEIESLRALKPSHLWVDLDLGNANWRSALISAAGNAAAMGASLDLSVIAGQDTRTWEPLAAAMAEERIDTGRVFAFPPVTLPVVFPRHDLVTHPETANAAKDAFAGTAITVGGGTRAYFTELNRAADFLPLGQLDAVTYTINPQVHAFDNLSLIETLAAQAETVTSAREIAGDLPLIVGPITLKPRYNPNATSLPPELGPDQLPDAVDPRQLSLLGAGWTLASIHRLAAVGADALTYYELTGWRGLMERREGLTRRDLFPSIPGGLFPLYHVFAAVAWLGPTRVAAVTLADELSVEALALCDEDRVRLLVTNLTETERTVDVAIPGIRNMTVRVLDDTSYLEAAEDPAYFAKTEDALPGEQYIAVNLRPFAIACVDGFSRSTPR